MASLAKPGSSTYRRTSPFRLPLRAECNGLPVKRSHIIPQIVCHIPWPDSARHAEDPQDQGCGTGRKKRHGLGIPCSSFRNRLPKPRNGISPSRFVCHKNSLPTPHYMKKVSCHDIRCFRRCNTTIGPDPNRMGIKSTWPADAPPWLMAMESGQAVT